eukprot:1450383-Amphidinium_carterae.1
MPILKAVELLSMTHAKLENPGSISAAKWPLPELTAVRILQCNSILCVQQDQTPEQYPYFIAMRILAGVDRTSPTEKNGMQSCNQMKRCHIELQPRTESIPRHRKSLETH